MRDERNGATSRPRGRPHSEGKEGEEGKGEKEASCKETEGSGVVVLPSMAETVQRLLAEAGIEKRDDRVVHLLVDLLQRETLSLLADAADIVDYRQKAAHAGGSSSEKVESKEGKQGALAARAGDKKSRQAGRGPASMCIEEEDANVAVQEYTQKYVVQPNVVLDSARLCSLSNSLAVGQSTAAELILHRAVPTGSAEGTSSPLLGEPFVLRPVASGSGGGGTSSGLSGSSFGSAGPSGSAASSGTHAIVTAATNKHVLGAMPQGLPPYLPEDVSVNTLMPSWSLRSSSCAGKLPADGGEKRGRESEMGEAETGRRGQRRSAQEAKEGADLEACDRWPAGQDDENNDGAEMFFQKEHPF
ncbi:hypothetical protein TGPRC2_246670 [Toxoplasma gondii TgCatPRC2]|uniref:Uncharacterized protein n=1 Tax=Toxoplasma gondii TgCatPRC2 TaxID=1130821 RepID=A0A151HGB7_TOXGO|nr:hypothetical protein TGPRC2_246670 [Toxoplasma gondii TgCatPRC2]